MVPKTDTQSLVTLTHQGFINRIPVDSMNKQSPSGPVSSCIGLNTRTLDRVTDAVIAQERGHILFISTSGRCWRLPVCEIPLNMASQRLDGLMLKSHLLTDKRKQRMSEIAYMVPVDGGKDLTESRTVILGTSFGRVKKLALQDCYYASRYEGASIIKLQTVDLDETFEEEEFVIGAGLTGYQDQDEIWMASSSGRLARFYDSDVPERRRRSMGVEGIQIGMKDVAVALYAGWVPSHYEALLVYDTGYGKRVKMYDIPIRRRGCVGAKVVKDNGATIAGITALNHIDTGVVLTSLGKYVRLDFDQIPKCLNVTDAGTKLIRSNQAIVKALRIAPLGAIQEECPTKDDTSQPDIKQRVRAVMIDPGIEPGSWRCFDANGEEVCFLKDMDIEGIRYMVVRAIGSQYREYDVNVPFALHASTIRSIHIKDDNTIALSPHKDKDPMDWSVWGKINGQLVFGRLADLGSIHEPRDPSSIEQEPTKPPAQPEEAGFFRKVKKVFRNLFG